MECLGLSEKQTSLFGLLDRFSSENGEKKLKKHFREVHRIDYPNTLRFYSGIWKNFSPIFASKCLRSRKGVRREIFLSAWSRKRGSVWTALDRFRLKKTTRPSTAAIPASGQEVASGFCFSPGS